MKASEKPIRQRVFDACDTILERGERPGMMAVRAIVGQSSSANTVQSAINDWWNMLALRVNALKRIPAVPPEVGEAAMQFWLVASGSASAIFESERQNMQQKVNDAESAANDAIRERNELVSTHEKLQADLSAKSIEATDLAQQLASETSRRLSAEESLSALKQDNEALRETVSRMQSEHAEHIDRIHSESEAKIIELQNSFKADLELAHYRFESSEKRMLLEIDRARDETKATEKRLSGVINRLESDLTISQATYQKQLSELRGMRNEGISRENKLEARVEQLVSENERLHALLKQFTQSGLTHTERKRNKLKATIHSRAARNLPIVEKQLDEIVARLNDGQSPTLVALWLSTEHQFDGGGAALNLVLKKLGAI